MSAELNAMIETIKKEIKEGGVLYEVQGDEHILSLNGAPWITERGTTMDQAIAKMAEYALSADAKYGLQLTLQPYFVI